MQVEAGEAHSLELTPAHPVQPSNQASSISMEDFMQQFDLNTFTVAFIDAWGNRTKKGVDCLFEVTLSVHARQTADDCENGQTVCFPQPPVLLLSNSNIYIFFKL